MPQQSLVGYFLEMELNATLIFYVPMFINPGIKAEEILSL